MKITWALVALALVGIGYGMGRFTGVQERPPSGPPPRKAPVVTPPGELASEHDEYITAIRTALNEPMLLERTALTADLMQELTPANAADAAQAFFEEGASTAFNHLLIDAWAHFDPRAAFRYIKTRSEFAQAEILPQLLESWATLDPHAAKRAYRTLMEPLKGGKPSRP